MATDHADIPRVVGRSHEQAEQRGLGLEDLMAHFQTGIFLFTETKPV